MKIRGILLTGLFLTACGLLSGSAGAQQGAGDADLTDPVEVEGDDEYTEGIEERVVLAGESEGVADFEAGDSVKGFDASDLEALGASNIADLAKFTPNLEIVTAGSTAPTFFIRGVGLNDFNANSSGAVAIYQDDVAMNSPALQLGTLFDMEAVNVERGPQGTGPFRNASAGAIKLYSRKPSGGYGGYLTGTYGRFNYVDLEGAVEAPIYEDILSSRFSFRYRDRKGWAKNGCGGAPPRDQRSVHGPALLNAGMSQANYEAALLALGVDPARVPNPDPRAATDSTLSICGESVPRVFNVENIGEELVVKDGISDVPEGLPTDVNSQHSWAARGIFRFEPTLDQEWLLIGRGSRRDEHSRLGQAIGTDGSFCDPNQDISLCFQPFRTSVVNQLIGSPDAGRYRDPDITEQFEDFLAEELDDCGAPCNVNNSREQRTAVNNAKIRTAEKVGPNLDKRPFRGDYNNVGKTKNDTWGVSVKGDVALPGEVEMRTVSGYDGYDRFTDVDLDQSPNTLFEIVTDDDGWQFMQDLSFSHHPFEDIGLRVEAGGFYLMEELNVNVRNDFGSATIFGVAEREYTQKLWAAAGYFNAELDFFDDFTLDGGVRYNWEKKEIDYRLVQAAADRLAFESEDWSAPTGTIRLTYRFREDTHAYWKYTRGFKGGHYNATSSLEQGVTNADPEHIDAFETGIRGAWWDGRLNLNLSVFYYDYKDYQLFTTQDSFDGAPEFVVINASDARVYGAEVDVHARPFPGTYLAVNFSWLESKFIDFVQVQLVQQSVGLDTITAEKEIQNSGNRLLNSPEFKVALTAEQTVPLGRFGQLVARWDGAWSDDTFFDGTNGKGIPNDENIQFMPDDTIGQKAHWLHNARLAYLDPTGTVEVAGWVRNITNEAYKTFAFDGATFRKTTIYFTGDPRTYGGTLTVRF